MNFLKWLFFKSTKAETLGAQQTLIVSAPTTFEQLLALSKSYNGFEREKALILLQQTQDPRALPAIIVRLNDWVPQVSAAAETAFISFFKPENSHAIVELLIEIDRLRKAKRHDHAKIITKFLEYLKREENCHNLVSAARSPNQKLAFLAFKLCAEFELLNPTHLLYLAIETKNLSCLGYSVNLLDQVSAQDLPSIAFKLFKFRSPRLLSKTLELLHTFNKNAVLELAQTLHFCKSAELRRLGRRYSQMKDLDFVELYSAALSAPDLHPNRINICLIELARIKNTEVLPLLKIHLKNSIPSVRRTSLQLFVKLSPNESKQRILNALLDSNTAVKNEAARLSISAGIYFDATELLELYAIQQSLDLMHCIFRLSKKTGKWPRLFLLLNLLDMNRSNPNAISEINFELNRWYQSFNLGSNFITHGDLQKLRISRGNLQDLIYKENQITLDFILKTA